LAQACSSHCSLPTLTLQRSTTKTSPITIRQAVRKMATAAAEVLSVKRLRPEAVMPVRGSEAAAGFDLAAAEGCQVPAGGKAIVKTGLSIAIPQNTYARIAPRSGLAAKKMINCGAGVVDYDYRGEVGVVLFNHGPEAFDVAPGDRVAQLILERICMADCQEVDELPSTARGAGGFGSTGVAGAAAAVAPVAGRQGEETVAVVKASSGSDAAALRVKRLNPAASLPARGSTEAAGFDLAAAEASVIQAGGKGIVKTGLSIAIPWGTYARIAPRSGLAAKKMIQAGAGVVDYDYRGEVGVVLFNHGTEDFEVKVGDRVAQLILEQISMCLCEEVQELGSTERGAGGFGSTGVSEAVAAVAAKDGEPLVKKAKVDKDASDVAALQKMVAELSEQVAVLSKNLAFARGA